MKTKILCAGIVAALLVPSPWLPLLWCNGGKAKNVFYSAEVSLGAESGGTCRFSIDANPVLFYFTTVNTKYQVLLIRVEALKGFRIERQMPDSISFSIASLTKSVELRQPAKMLA